MEKDKMCGAAVERGRITEVTETGSGTAYTVESIDRPGAVTLTIPAMGDRLAAEDVVYFSLFPDGTGIILSGLAGKIVKATATQTEDGLMSAADKTKLDTVEPGGEPNQNAFSNVKVGSTTIAAQTETDTVELAAGDNVTLTPDAAGKKVTVNATNLWSFEAGTAIPANSDLNDYITAGNYRCESGTIANTIQNNPLGTNPFVLKVFDAQETGVLVQWAIQGNGVRMFLRRYANNAFSDWVRYTTDEATTGSSGYMSATDKTKLDGHDSQVWGLNYGTSIPKNSNLNDYTTPGNYRAIDSTYSSTISNAPFTNEGFILKVFNGSNSSYLVQWVISASGTKIYIRSKYSTTWSAWANYLTNNATTSADGYMSSTDKSVLDTSTVRGSKAAPTGSTSLDQINTSGIYWLASSNYPNGWPDAEGTGAKNALLNVYYDGGGARVQILTMYSGTGENRMYCRMYINSQWYAWRQISTGSGIAWSLDIGAQIAANSDLNNFKTPGSYTSPTNITPTLSHKPPTTSNAFILKVMVGHVANTVVQYAIDVTGTLISIRYFNTSSWGSWYKYTGTAV